MCHAGAATAKKSRAQGNKAKAAVSNPPRRTVGAISRSGHTKAGRVRQKSHKQAELIAVGTLRCVCSLFASCASFDAR